MSFPLLAFVLQVAVATDSGTAARNPAFARDGRLAVSVQGDIWTVRGGNWKQVTSGPGWDREPTWSSDGSTIVFSSDRAGQFDLWRVAATGGEAERITTSPFADGQPALARDGRIVFVRGRLGAATLWVRSPN